MKNCITALILLTLLNFKSVEAAKQKLTDPLYEAAYIEQWLEKAVPEIFSFHFGNYKDVFQSSEKYFDRQGWKKFRQALKRSDLLEFIKLNQIIMETKIIDDVKLCKQGVNKKSYHWVYSMPIERVFLNGQNKKTSNEIVSVLVKRSKEGGNESNIAINQFIMLSKDMVDGPCDFYEDLELKSNP